MRPIKSWQGTAIDAVGRFATVPRARLHAVARYVKMSSRKRLQLRGSSRLPRELGLLGHRWLVLIIVLVIAAAPGYGQVGYPSERVSVSGGAPEASASLSQSSNDSLPQASWTAPRNGKSDQSTSNRATRRENSSPVVTAGGQQPVGGSVEPTSAAESSDRGSEQQAAARSNGIPLPPPSKSQHSATDSSSSSTFKSLVSVGSSLLIVIGLFLGVAWCYRKGMQTSLGGGHVPKQVVQVLGRTPLATRQQLVLIRFGSKLVLVSMVQGDARTISEITDPLEVDQLAGLCESGQPESITNSFRSILAQGGSR